jgi:hypothetical protein
MNHLPTYLIMLASLLALFGCAERHTIHTGTFEGEPYELVSVETKGFSTNSIHYELRSDLLPTLRIDPNTTDWGPPYADDLYGTAPRTYLTTNPPPYRNTPGRGTPDSAMQHPATMLYLQPGTFSHADFVLSGRLLKQEWPGIFKRLGHDPYTRFPNIIGVVYGLHDQFRRVFIGQGSEAHKAVTIEADGRVRYGAADGSFEEFGGLSEQVQMPGKRILLKPGGLTLAQLRTYRDIAGKTLFDLFVLTQESDTANE